jgi:hypothetical protein
LTWNYYENFVEAKNEPQNIEQRITNAEGEKRRDLTSSFEIPWSPFISLWLAGAAEGG